MPTDEVDKEIAVAGDESAPPEGGASLTNQESSADLLNRSQNEPTPSEEANTLREDGGTHSAVKVEAEKSSDTQIVRDPPPPKHIDVGSLKGDVSFEIAIDKLKDQEKTTDLQDCSQNKLHSTEPLNKIRDEEGKHSAVKGENEKLPNTEVGHNPPSTKLLDIASINGAGSFEIEVHKCEDSQSLETGRLSDERIVCKPDGRLLDGQVASKLPPVPQELVDESFEAVAHMGDDTVLIYISKSKGDHDTEQISQSAERVVDKADAGASDQVITAREPVKIEQATTKGDGSIEIRAQKGSDREIGNSNKGSISALSLYQAMSRERDDSKPSPGNTGTAPVVNAQPMYPSYYGGYQSYYPGFPATHAPYPTQHPLSMYGARPYQPTPGAPVGNDPHTAAHQEWWAKYYDHYYKLTARNLGPGMPPPPPPNPWTLPALPTLVSQHQKETLSASGDTQVLKKQRLDEAGDASQGGVSIAVTEENANRGDQDIEASVELGQASSDEGQQQSGGKTI